MKTRTKLNTHKQSSPLVLIVFFITLCIIYLIHIGLDCVKRRKERTSAEKDINPNSIPRITYQQLTSCAGFENTTEEEANYIIESLVQFSVITYKNLFHEQYPNNR